MTAALLQINSEVAPELTPEPKIKTKSKSKSRAKAAPKLKHDDHLFTYAYTGVAMMAVLSAGLNGYANSLHATVEFAGWAMGVVIPAIILILGKVAGILWKRRQNNLAYVTAGAGIGLLLLSVWHCACSIAMLTGCHIIAAVPMAVAIDVGFVACELAAAKLERNG
jgi:hypothetical protein